jgi:hypothetical protein
MFGSLQRFAYIVSDRTKHTVIMFEILKLSILRSILYHNLHRIHCPSLYLVKRSDIFRCNALSKADVSDGDNPMEGHVFIEL